MRVEATCVAELYVDKDFKLLCDEYAKYQIKRLPTPSFDYGIYAPIEKAGALRVFRAVQGESLIGFASVMTSKVPHYGLQLSVVESLFVRKACRSSGAGDALVDAAIAYARNSSSVGIFVNCPWAAITFRQALIKKGFTPETINLFMPL